MLRDIHLYLYQGNVYNYCFLGTSHPERDTHFSLAAQTEFNRLNKIGIKAESLPKRKKCFLEAQSEHFTYNIKDYTVDGFTYGTLVDCDRYLGNVIWMGRHHKTKPETRDDIYIGLELVSMCIVKMHR